MPATLFIALGSNRRHGLYGTPARVLDAAVAALGAAELAVVARSTWRTTAPVGPRQRRFVNGVVATVSNLPPAEVLKRLKAIEAAFGRRPARRWGPRVLDLDLIAAGDFATAHWPTSHRGLIVPHPGLAARDFVLQPLVEVAPDWRHPVLHLRARQLRARLLRPRPARSDP